MSGTGDLAKPELLFELARGGMGAVHLARVGGIGGFERFVVVKRILDNSGHEAEVLERFLSEARIAARIHHANVVGTHHVGTDDAGLYMVLDYVEGGSLSALTDRAVLRGDLLPVPVVLRIALDALAGLGAVHRATGSDGQPLGIVHRDVSLQNILVGRDGVARLADFGIARSTRPSYKTKTGSLVGKLSYLPPEHIRQEPTDHTMDIYMLGITLWCALTGEEPWAGTDEAQVMHSILTDTLAPVSSRRNEPIAPEIEALVATAAHPVPGERYQSAADMAQAIETLGRERGWVASQHEVASFVEGLLGFDLEKRRERIAQIQPRPRTVATLQPEAPLAAKRSTRGKGLIWLLAALLLVGAAVYLMPARERAAAIQQEDSPAASPPTPESTKDTALTTTTPDPAPSAPAIPAAVPSAASAPSLPATSSEPAPKRNPAVASPKAAPAKSATPPTAPDDISPRNPYR